MTPLLSFENLQFRYEPFPIGLAAPVMDDDRYRQMLDNFPELQRFTAIEDFGRKYALSEKHNPRYYRALVTENPVWREFYYWIKSPDFIESVLDALPCQIGMGCWNGRGCVVTLSSGGRYFPCHVTFSSLHRRLSSA